MTNTLTQDGLLFLSAIAAITAIIYTIIKAMRNDGIAILPDWLVPGDWWDICLHRNLVLISAKHKDDVGLIARSRSGGAILLTGGLDWITRLLVYSKIL